MAIELEITLLTDSDIGDKDQEHEDHTCADGRYYKAPACSTVYRMTGQEPPSYLL